MPVNITLIDGVVQGHEGLRLTAYRDTLGKLTIARGFCLSALGAPARCAAAGVNFEAACAGQPITIYQANTLYVQAREAAIQCGRSLLPNLDAMPDPAVAVVVDMIYELGCAGFDGFGETIAALKAGDWAAAAADMRASLWDAQVPVRAANNIAMIERLAVIEPARGASTQAVASVAVTA